MLPLFRSQEVEYYFDYELQIFGVWSMNDQSPKED